MEPVPIIPRGAHSQWALPNTMDLPRQKNSLFSSEIINNKTELSSNPIYRSTQIHKINVRKTKEQIIQKRIDAKTKIEKKLETAIALNDEIGVVDNVYGKINLAISVYDTIKNVVSTVLDKLVDFKLVELPEYPNAIKSKLPASVSLNSIYGLLKDSIELGNGITNFVIKAYIRSVAMEKIAELKANIDKLSEEQIDQLEELVKEIQYEDDQFYEELSSLGVSSASTLCSYASFSLKWMTDKVFQDALSSGLGAVGSGLKVISTGISLYGAHTNVKVTRDWARDFDNWIINQDPTAAARAETFKKAMIEHDRELGIFHEKVTEEGPTEAHIANAITNRDEAISKVVAKRVVRQQSEVEKLQQRIHNNELSMDDVIACIRKFKPAEWKNEDDVIVTLEDWIANEPRESLLLAYIDYHSVLDPTIKNSLAQMVTKKQEIQQFFLEDKRLEKGISFLAAKIMFAVSATFAIIGLVATPVGLPL